MTPEFGQRMCECGKPWTPNAEGRWLHKQLFDHAPTAARPEPVAVPTGISPTCKRGDHNGCGRGYIDAGTPTECVCRCGHVEGRAYRRGNGIEDD